jgi:hypothetical protein
MSTTGSSLRDDRVLYQRELWISTDTGNKVSRYGHRAGLRRLMLGSKCTISGSQNITLGGKTIIEPVGFPPAQVGRLIRRVGSRHSRRPAAYNGRIRGHSSRKVLPHRRGSRPQATLQDVQRASLPTKLTFRPLNLRAGASASTP